LPDLLAAPPAIIGNNELVTLEKVEGEANAFMLMKINTNRRINITMVVINDLTKSATEIPRLFIASRITIFFSSAIPLKNYAKLRSPVLSESTLENI
jgi:hypothetical protein